MHSVTFICCLTKEGFVGLTAILLQNELHMLFLVSFLAVSTTLAKPLTAKSWRLRMPCWTAPAVGGTTVPSATLVARQATSCKCTEMTTSSRARFVCCDQVWANESAKDKKWSTHLPQISNHLNMCVCVCVCVKFNFARCFYTSWSFPGSASEMPGHLKKNQLPKCFFWSDQEHDIIAISWGTLLFWHFQLNVQTPKFGV